jgi:putative Mg2+ transporter-C (MgtC) family protein
MFVRFAIAIALGAVLGIERELVGKEEAGVRTLSLVTSGAAIFAMIGLTLPYVVSSDGSGAVLANVVQSNSGYLTIIANIVVGIGFLGAGIIIKQNDHPRGVTTAALVWTAAAIGILVGIGLTEFAVVCAFILGAFLYAIRRLNISRLNMPKKAGRAK